MGDARNGGLEVVHISISGNATANHLGHAQARAPLDEVLGDVLGLGGEDVFLQPIIEGVVVGEAAEQAHGCVGVPVDQAGQDQCAACVLYRFPGLIPGFDSGSLANRGDRPVADGDCAVFDHTAVCIHSDERAAADEKVRAIHGPEPLFHCEWRLHSFDMRTGLRTSSLSSLPKKAAALKTAALHLKFGTRAGNDVRRERLDVIALGAFEPLGMLADFESGSKMGLEARPTDCYRCAKFSSIRVITLRSRATN